MPEPNAVPPGAVPSARALLRSTTIAAASAVVLLLTVVLPAEFGVDVTRVGRLLGLTPMGEIKMALAREAKAHGAGASPQAVPPVAAVEEISSQATPADSVQRSDRTTITLSPNQGREIKLIMRSGARATYAWSTGSGLVNFNTHGEPYNAPSDFYHSYGKGAGVTSDRGALVAAFDGLHGWFWRNVSSSDVTVTLETSGEYQDIRIIE